jgi:hypothetical protein
MDSKVEELELQTSYQKLKPTKMKKKKKKQRKPQYLQWNTKQTESLKQTFNDFEWGSESPDFERKRDDERWLWVRVWTLGQWGFFAIALNRFSLHLLQWERERERQGQRLGFREENWERGKKC